MNAALAFHVELGHKGGPRDCVNSPGPCSVGVVAARNRSPGFYRALSLAATRPEPSPVYASTSRLGRRSDHRAWPGLTAQGEARNNA